MKFVIYNTGRTHWYFHIVAANGKTLAVSEAYTRKRNALEAVALIREQAESAALDVPV